MGKATFFVLSIPLLAAAAMASEWVALNSSTEPFGVQVLASDGERTVLKYTVNRYLNDEITIAGKNYTLFAKLPKESMIEEEGFPRLPRINRSIVIPDEGTMGCKVVSARFIEVEKIDVAPSKGNFSREVDPESVPYTFGDVYQKDTFFPSRLVTLREPYIMRDFRGMVVELNAFQYNPATRVLRIYTDVMVEIRKTASGGENVLVRSEPMGTIDLQFHKIYKRHFVNFSAMDYPYLAESGGMLVLCYDAFIPDMDPFVTWKNQKGIPTVIVPISQVGSTANEILSYIRSYYYENDLCYVLLVGDAPQIPTFSDGSDPVYSLLAGTDSYPEIFVGRFSAENSTQVQTQVERTIAYEKYPDPALNWFHQGLGTADTDGPCNPEQYDYQHISLIARDLLHWNYTQVDSVYMPWGNTEMISHYLDEGRSILNYAGHGWTYGMGPPNFTVDDVNDLVNDNMLPHIVTIACQPGNFVSTTCFAEAWLRATNEATGAPTGAIATYMSKISQTWFPPYDMQDEGIDLLTTDSVLTFGGLCFNGSGLMIDIHGYWGEYEFKNWTIFGDPSLYVRSAAPYDLAVTHDPYIYTGATSFEVSVASATGTPVEAMVCATNDEIYATGLTSATGQVTLIFDPPVTQSGTFTLTVTESNSVPYVAEVDIVSFSAPDVTITLTPAILPIIIPPSGGSFDYNLEVTNNEATAVDGDVWTDVTLPDGTIFGPVLGPVNVTFPESSSLNRDRTQSVPGSAPVGDYFYHAYVGISPDVIWDEDSFPFSKTGAGDAGGEWSNIGESFEGLGVDGQPARLPEGTLLVKNYPNPFNPTTTIRFDLPREGWVKLDLYDIAGRNVGAFRETPLPLVNGWREAGSHEVTFDGTGLPSGIYFARLQAGNFVGVQKMVLLK